MTGPISPTRRQTDLLRFIRGFVETHGFAPTIREICAGMGTKSTHRAREMLLACHERGHIEHFPYEPRGIELLVDISIPRTPDGAPLYAVRFG